MSDATAAPADATPSTPPVATLSEADIERLTEKVYRLMLSDLRREKARRGGQR